jgi:cytochrome c oxidase subunit 4
MEHASSEHAHPTPKLYGMILTALIALTLITVVVAYQDFGVLNNVIALGIAGLKTTLVVLFFMHVKYSKLTTKIFAAAGFFWLSILIFFTIADTESRRPADRPHGWVQTPAERRAAQQPAHAEQHGAEPAATGEHH